MSITHFLHNTCNSFIKQLRIEQSDISTLFGFLLTTKTINSTIKKIVINIKLNNVKSVFSTLTLRLNLNIIDVAAILDLQKQQNNDGIK